MTSYQPMFLTYAEEHGMTVEEMLEHDKREYNGGIMCGYMLWVSNKVSTFWKKHPDALYYSYARRDK